MRILITGASGFIGGHLFYSAPRDWAVLGTHLHWTPPKRESGWVPLDLLKFSALRNCMDNLQPDLIIHAAALSRIAFCQNNAAAAWKTNYDLTAELAGICGDKKLRLILLSSDMVFDGVRGHYSELDATNPLNVYGSAKLAAEREVLRLDRRGVVLRLNLTYGRPRAGGRSFSEEIIQVVAGGQPYRLFADQFRSFMSVQNLAKCVWEIAGGDYFGLLHLGGSQAADRFTFGTMLAQRANLRDNLLIPASVAEAENQNFHPRNNTFDLAKAKNILKTPLLDLGAGLALEYPSE